MSEFALGFSAPLHGLRLLISHPRLMRRAVLPFLVGFFFFVFGGIFGFSALLGLLPTGVANLFHFLSLDPLGWPYWLIYYGTLILAWPVALFALFYVLLLLAKLVASPLFALLAEAVLSERGKRFQFISWMRSSVRMFGISLLKLIVFGLAGVILFFLSIIPGLGLFTGFGFLLLVAYDVSDSTFEVYEMSFAERMQCVRTHFPFFSGLSLALGLAFLIPGLNFVLLPIAIAGSADMLRLLLGDRS
jgi:uncharacterized protein involved in cysteine biosynthesis